MSSGVPLRRGFVRHRSTPTRLLALTHRSDRLHPAAVQQDEAVGGGLQVEQPSRLGHIHARQVSPFRILTSVLHQAAPTRSVRVHACRQARYVSRFLNCTRELSKFMARSYRQSTLCVPEEHVMAFVERAARAPTGHPWRSQTLPRTPSCSMDAMASLVSLSSFPCAFHCAYWHTKQYVSEAHELLLTLPFTLSHFISLTTALA